MRKLMNKKLNKKGFTLMEMLIVVAIIAILVAIMIPTYMNAMTKAKEATDVANIRAYYAEVTMKYMLDDEAYPTSAGTSVEVDGVTYTLQAGTMTFNTKTGDTTYFGITYTPTSGHTATTVGKPATA